jgi:hypothetical protein
MVDRLERAALFEDPSHLLSAFDILCGHEPYPSRLLFVPSQGWAVDTASLGTPAELNKLALQFGWKVEFPASAVTGRWVPTQSDLTGRWTYRDPLKAMEWAGHAALPIPEDPNWALLDPTIPHMQFLLGARDEATAQCILDAISTRFGQGIRALPVLLEPDGSSPCEYQYFWKVFLERPNPFLFGVADRVWWRPQGVGRVEIFLEYPWSLEVQPAQLHRIPWAKNTGVVLLSKAAPEVIELRHTQQGTVYSDYLGTIALTKGAAEVTIPVVASQQVPDARLKVDIRLGRPDPHAFEQMRTKELKREIDAKTQVYEHLLSRQRHEETDAAFHPLFLYAQSESERERRSLPTEIQRLIVEWSDQPADIGAIRYGFLPADDLPAGMFPDGTSVHVVVAAVTLGAEDCTDVSARLLDYAPKTPNSWNLVLNKDWADNKLRLFTPSSDHIWLYPNLRPNALTASALASAIHPGISADKNKWLYLALPGRSDNLRFVLLPIEALQPLSTVFSGLLEIGADISTPKVREVLGGKVLSAVFEAVDANMTETVGRAATERLDEATRRLKAEVAILSDDLEKRKKSTAAAQASANALGDQSGALTRFLTDALAKSNELGSLLQQIVTGFQGSGSQLQSLRTMIDRQQALCEKINEEILTVGNIYARQEDSEI